MNEMNTSDDNIKTVLATKGDCFLRGHNALATTKVCEIYSVEFCRKDMLKLDMVPKRLVSTQTTRAVLATVSEGEV